jgi:pimeloyl-ACP methyl ester carboxylesterase
MKGRVGACLYINGKNAGFFYKRAVSSSMSLHTFSPCRAILSNIMYRFIPVRLALVVLCVVNLPWAWARTTLPTQLGPHPVSIKQYELRTKRLDPWSPISEERKLMLTIFQPDMSTNRCHKPSYVEYMPPKAAVIYDDHYKDQIPNGTFERVQLRSCAPPKKDSKWWEKAPLLLFSPGLGNGRLVGSAMNAAIASSGYTIVSIDHTYASAAVEFPDGSVAMGNQAQRLDSNNLTAFFEVMTDMVAAQSDDIDDVLEAVSAGKMPGLAGNKKLTAGIYGHSLGGATAVYAMVNRTRLLGGLNYDGPYATLGKNENVDRPFLGLGEEYLIANNDTTWTETYQHETGWKSEIAFNGTQHNTFTDMPLLLKTLDLRRTRNATEYESFFGSIDGQRAMDIAWRYTVTFFDFVLKGKRDVLLQGNSTEFPEAVFIRGNRGGRFV